ncbi:ERI1 exoribonuclease 2 isoform X2 [Saccopteryx leptura]|uniref:ERI1 exoribonuclease 2 isoform X2 n=1 Tax=Saccopteryx leptura TaxID=249018 RepID=UPI00339BD4C7
MATKKLARQLGLIRRKSVAPANENLGKSKFKQLFDYLIVIDFESTCWNDGKHHLTQEITVLLNTSTGEIDSEFHAYVQPEEHPILSEFCMELTGIKQAQVDEGVPLKICLSQFCKWIQKIQQQKNIIFATGVSDLSTSEVKLCAFVTWSDWDLGVCLEYECKRKQLLKPAFLTTWIDLRVTYKSFYRRKPQGLRGALQEVGIEFSGREHSGLDDSRNTALLAWKMIRDGCLMKITRSLNKVPTKKNPNTVARGVRPSQAAESPARSSSERSPSTGRTASTTRSHEEAQVRSVGVNPIKVRQEEFPPKSGGKVGLSPFNTKPRTTLGPLPCPVLRTPVRRRREDKLRAPSAPSTSSAVGSELVLVSTTVSAVNHVSDTEMGSALDCLPMLADWEDVAFLPASQPDQNIDCVPPRSDSSSATPVRSGERGVVLTEAEVLSCQHRGGVGDTPGNPETAQSIVYESPQTTIYNVREAPGPRSDVSDFKLPECKSSGFNSTKAGLSYTSVLGGHLLGGAKRNLSGPPAFPLVKKQTFSIHEDWPVSSEGSPARGCSGKVPSVLTSPGNLQQPWRVGKMTPPLCRCGRRARRLVASNNGPNHGRAFFCCPVRKNQENRHCCGYFKWEQTLQKEKANGLIPSRSPGGLAVSSLETSRFCDQTVNVSTENPLRLRPSMRT